MHTARLVRTGLTHVTRMRRPSGSRPRPARRRLPSAGYCFRTQ